MFKFRRKHLVYPLIAFLIVYSWVCGFNVGRVYSNGLKPTIDELLGIFNMPWGNFTQGINAPKYILNDDLDVDVTDRLREQNATGFTAYVGFDSRLEYLPNYFFCDGMADDVEINAAATLVNAMGGGTVHISACPVGLVYDIKAWIRIYSYIIYEGEGWNTTLRVADGTVTNVFHSDYSEQVTGAVIRDLQIDGNNANNPLTDTENQNGIDPEYGHEIVVERCYVHDMPSACVHLDRGVRCIFRNNVFKASFYDLMHIGVMVTGGEDNLIEGNTLSEGTGAGIAIGGDHVGTRVIGNHIDSNGGAGITLVDVADYRPHDILICANLIENNTGNGVHVLGMRNKVVSNTILGNYDGIYFGPNSNDGSIQGNSIYDNNRHGIYIHTADFNIISGNQVNGCTGNGISLYMAEDNTIEINTIMDNGASGIELNDDGANPCLRTVIIGNRISSHTYGIRERSLTDYSEIFHNDLTGNTNFAVIIGINTRLPEISVYVIEPNTTLGTHPAVNLPDNSDTTVRFQVQIPKDFQQLVTSYVIVAQTVTAGSPDMQWSAFTNFGNPNLNEAYNMHTDSRTDQVRTINQNILVYIDISDVFSGLAAGDLVGLEFIRRATQAGDTIDGSAYVLEFILLYV